MFKKDQEGYESLKLDLASQDFEVVEHLPQIYKGKRCKIKYIGPKFIVDEQTVADGEKCDKWKRAYAITDLKLLPAGASVFNHSTHKISTSYVKKGNSCEYIAPKNDIIPDVGYIVLK